MSEEILLRVVDTVLTLASIIIGFLLGLWLRGREDKRVDAGAGKKSQ